MGGHDGYRCGGGFAGEETPVGRLSPSEEQNCQIQELYDFGSCQRNGLGVGVYHVFSQLITPCECRREHGGGALKEALGLADGASGDGTGAAQILLLEKKVAEKAVWCDDFHGRSRQDDSRDSLRHQALLLNPETDSNYQTILIELMMMTAKVPLVRVVLYMEVNPWALTQHLISASRPRGKGKWRVGSALAKVHGAPGKLQLYPRYLCDGHDGVALVKVPPARRHKSILHHNQRMPPSSAAQRSATLAVHPWTKHLQVP